MAQFDSKFFFSVEPITQRQISILNKLTPFYTEEIIQKMLLPLINQSSNISLRSLDWLVTNYAKKHNIVCATHSNELFNIYHGYKIALAHYRRRNFDPFRRRQRIHLRFNDTTYETTVGQCNFLQWAFVNGVLKYAIDNSIFIEKDMNQASLKHKLELKKQYANGTPYKRQELSSAPKCKCSVYQIDSQVSFKLLNESDSDNEEKK